MENPDLSDTADKLVLIVDDEQGIRDFLEIIIRKEGFKVELSGDGADALNKIRTLSPDIVILDLMLPKYNGLEILRELQADERAGIPIIIMTGRQMDSSTADMIRQESNVREFIQKPVKKELLLSFIHRLLKTRPKAKNPVS